MVCSLRTMETRGLHSEDHSKSTIFASKTLVPKKRHWRDQVEYREYRLHAVFHLQSRVSTTKESKV
jgi:hypothetical protein